MEFYLWGPKLLVNDKLHILQKKAVRIITSSSYFGNSEPLFKQLRLLKTGDIYKCQLLKFIFTLTHKQLPHYFEQFTFIFRNQQHNHATRTCQSVSIPNVKTLWQAERHFCHLRFTGAATILSFFRSILLAWILLAKLSVNVQ